MANRKQPEIRFSGFIDDWEERKLHEVANHRGGTAIEKYFEKDGKYKVISIGSYGLDSKYVDQNIRAVSNEVTDGRVVHTGELTMVLNDKTANGTIIGRSLLIEQDNEYVINQRTEIISPKKTFDSDFAYTILNGSFREKVKRIVQGGTQIYANYPAVSNLSVELPNIEEQQKIGQFFKQLDETIALHQRKLELLKEQKKGFLQKMFPKAGANTPEVRFAGFTDDWEERKLGDTTEYLKGYAFKSKDYQDKGYRIIRVSDLGKDNIKQSKDTIFISEQIAKQQEKYLIKANEIIITTVGSKAEMKESAVGRPIIVKESFGFLLNQNLVKIYGKPSFDNYFIYSQLLQSRYTDYVSMIERGNANQANIAISDLWEFKFLTPSFEEQQKIGSFFEQLDDTITLHQRELELLKETKKGFLQKMFV